MRSNALSQFARKVFNDEETKKQFFANPESVMSQFNLTEPEKKAVLSKHAMMALATPGSSGSNIGEGPMAAWF